MKLQVQVPIAASRAAIWAVITDIAHAQQNISGIEKIEILEQPARGVVGLKWRETRTLFGKTAIEVMWITEAVENEFYRTRAESHGFIFLCELRIDGHDGRCSLSMSHESQPVSFMAKLMSVPMALGMKGMLKKALLQDLQDIKAVVERRAGGSRA